MSAILQALLARLDLADLGLDPGGATITGADPVLACRYPLGEATAAVLAATGLAAVDLAARSGARRPHVTVDVRHAGATLRGFLDQVLDGEQLDPDPTSRLPVVGLHRAADDRWVQVYGAFAPLLERTTRVLGCEPDREAVAAAVGRWQADPLVEALVAAGAPAARVMTAEAWAAHPQGAALAQLPPVVVERIGEAPASRSPAVPHATPSDRPLAGIRVVDLSRIVAGPVCARTLAELGATVVQAVDPRRHLVRRAHLDTSAGKEVVELDLDDPAGHQTVLRLVDAAEVVVQNASPGSLAARGLGPEDLAQRRPGLVYVSIDAYGHVGPWSSRRGFEPLAQASTGWAADHAADAGSMPRIVPGLPCDHVSGYLAALGAVTALRRRRADAGSWHVRTSLARAAMWLRDQPGQHDPQAAPPLGARATRDLRTDVRTDAGVLGRLRPAIVLDHAQAPARRRT